MLISKLYFQLPFRLVWIYCQICYMNIKHCDLTSIRAIRSTVHLRLWEETLHHVFPASEDFIRVWSTIAQAVIQVAVCFSGWQERSHWSACIKWRRSGGAIRQRFRTWRTSHQQNQQLCGAQTPPHRHCSEGELNWDHSVLDFTDVKAEISVWFPLQCHQTRSVNHNRKLARDILREKLEVEYKGEESELLRRQRESIQKKQDKRRKVNENIEKKRRFKETLNTEGGDFSIKSQEPW